MGQIIIPSEKKINGPWFLDISCLEDLSETLSLIEEKFNNTYEFLVDRAAETELNDSKRWNDDIDIDGARLKVKESFNFRKNEKYALLSTKQGKKIKYDNLLDLVKSNQISEFNPTHLKIHIKKGPCELTIEITTNHDGEFQSRIKVPDDTSFNDVNYELTKWIDKHKPNLVLQKWSSWFPLAALPIIAALFAITPDLLKEKVDIYNSELKQESLSLLKDGLSDDETTKAIEIILQRESGYIPESFNPEIKINKTILNIWTTTLIALGILIIKPKTVIGLGKSKWRIGFYRKWTYIVLVYIPLSIIIPIVKSKIL